VRQWTCACPGKCEPSTVSCPACPQPICPPPSCPVPVCPPTSCPACPNTNQGNNNQGQGNNNQGQGNNNQGQGDCATVSNGQCIPNVANTPCGYSFPIPRTNPQTRASHSVACAIPQGSRGTPRERQVLSKPDWNIQSCFRYIPCGPANPAARGMSYGAIAVTSATYVDVLNKCKALGYEAVGVQMTVVQGIELIPFSVGNIIPEFMYHTDQFPPKAGFWAIYGTTVENQYRCGI